MSTTELPEGFEIEGYAEIPVSDIIAHEHNPRPTFHLADDDPQLIALGESIAVDGQHRPAVVYEMIGGWREETSPGSFRLYQGERRWRAATLAGVETLRCHVVSAPKTEAEEWDWLGNEEAFKQDWQPFFTLRYCQELANRHGVPVHSAEISAKTGVAMTDLKIAEKLFKLEPAIQAFAAEYEEIKYEQLVKGRRRHGSRIRGHGIRSKEFPVKKAAAVYDVFDALRTHTPMLVSDYSDLDLQQLISQKATTGKATQEDLEKLYAQIRQTGDNPPVNLLSSIKRMLEGDDRSVRQALRATGAAHTEKLGGILTSSPRLRKCLRSVITNIDQVGTNPVQLQEVRNEVLELIRDAGELDRLLSERLIAQLTSQRG